MSDEANIPTLTDLIQESEEIKMSDLGLEDDPEVSVDDPFRVDAVIDVTEPDLVVLDPFASNPALEQTVRRILDEHMELAWQEIRLAIQRELNKP